MSEKTLFWVTLAVTFVLGACFGFWLRGLRPVRVPDPVVKTDTLWLRDTIKVDRPVPRIVRIVDTMLIPVIDTVHTRDSIFISIPREEKVYEDSTYRAVVSGYKPSLDSISVYQTTKVVTITETVRVPEKKRWGIGVQGGYGFGKAGASPYVGVGISYNVLTF